MKVRGLGTNKYKTTEYIIIPIYLLGTFKGLNIIVYIYRELYLVDNLRAKILISNNIISLESITINIANTKGYISSYKTDINVDIR